MTAYFDDLEREARELSERASDDQEFLVGLEGLEARLTRDVTLNTGDREFPDELREKALSVIALQAVTGGPLYAQQPLLHEKARRMALATRRSTLVGSLHSLFHRLAGARIKTRFGLWSDDPAGNLRLRDAHDQEAA